MKIKIFFHNYKDSLDVLERIEQSTKMSDQALYFLHVKKNEDKYLSENEIKAISNYGMWFPEFMVNNFNVFMKGSESSQKRNFDFFEQTLGVAVEHSEYYHWSDYLDYKTLNSSAIIKWQQNELIATRSPTLAVIKGNEFGYY